MTLEHYWTVLLKQWKLIVSCFLCVGLGAYIASLLMTPIYQSTAIVEITIRSASNQADINSLLASDQLVQTEAQLASSIPVLRTVASHYSGLTVETLSKEVTVTPELNTQLFQIIVQDPSPKRASALANDIADTLIKQQLQIAQQASDLANRQIQQALVAAKKQLDSINAQIVAVQATDAGTGTKQPEVNALQTQLSGAQQHYTQLQTDLDQLELTEAQNNNFLQVAQPAEPNTNAVRPSKLLNTSVGLVAGLLVGVLIALLLSQIDTRVRTAEAVTQLLNLPILATVWRVKSSKSTDVINPQGHDANVEAYRILRTSVGFSSIDKPLHSIMVTSAVPGEGKSVVAANLAIFMAKAGKKTLLVDADMRRPTVYEKLNLSTDKQGLSNAVMMLGSLGATNVNLPSLPGIGSIAGTPQFLAPRLDISHAIEPSSQGIAASSLDPFLHSVGIPHLRVMPSGPLPPNPSELLDSKAMQRLLSLTTTCGIDTVIFDAPPLLGLSDASILASKVDGVIVVVDVTRANKKQLQQVKGLLTQAGANVLGCVINKQQRSRSDTSYYYYYGNDPNGSSGAAKEAAAPHVSHVPHVPANALYTNPTNPTNYATSNPPSNSAMNYAPQSVPFNGMRGGQREQ